MSRTTWLVITIVGLGAFIVGGGVALMDDGTQAPSASNAPVLTASSPPALKSPSSTGDPAVSLAQDGDEGNDHGHSRPGKAKGEDKKEKGEHGKAKGGQGEED